MTPIPQFIWDNFREKEKIEIVKEFKNLSFYKRLNELSEKVEKWCEHIQNLIK